MFFLVLLAGGAFAAGNFNYNENGSRIEKNYLEGEVVRGVINISFSEQRNSEFTSNFNGTKKLLEVLNLSGYAFGRDFFCEPFNCERGYVELDGTGAESALISLGSNKKLYGFKLNGEKVSVSSMKFDINSETSQSSCTNQLYLDMFNDLEADFFNTNAGEVCETEQINYGCFRDDGNIEGSAIIDSTGYCEKIKLKAAPGYKVGAKIQKEGSGGRLQFKMYNLSGTYSGGFEVGDPQAGDVSVNIKYHPKKQVEEGYVCVSDSDNSGKFKIRFRGADDSCGRTGHPATPGTGPNFDYEIYAVPLKYAPIGTINFDEAVYKNLNGQELVKDVNGYLTRVYNNNCSNGCVIPIGLWGADNGIAISNVKIIYKRENVALEEKNIFEITNKDSSISSKHLLLSLEKMKFEVPNRDGNHDFLLYLDGEKILNETVNVDVGFDFSVSPRVILVGYKTLFRAISAEEIVSSSWKFGDGGGEVKGNKNEAEYAYMKEGEFIIEVSASNAAGESSTKKFKVIVGEPRTSANITIVKYETRIKDVEGDINSLPGWIGKEIKKEIKLDESSSSLTKIKNEFSSLKSDAKTEAYSKILDSLIKMDIPYSVYISKRGSLPGEIGFNNIDTSIIEEISGSEGGEELENNIIAWMDDNYDFEIDFEIFSIKEDYAERDIFGKYKISLEQKAAQNEQSYLVINYPRDSIIFMRDYGAGYLSDGSAVYIPIGESGEPGEIEFLAGGEVPNVDELGIYLSPRSDKFGGDKPLGEVYRWKFPWKFYNISMLFILLGTLILYIILQEWYKRYYEKRLFKNPDDLYNILNFVYNSRKFGLKDDEIKSKLGEKKWKREQATYAFRKIAGKRTGMWEIPLFKFLENRKVRQELERKQGVPLDARFIKRPSL